eukprot:6178445-Pleurochrysis_carterae.AAC.2
MNATVAVDAAACTLYAGPVKDGEPAWTCRFSFNCNDSADPSATSQPTALQSCGESNQSMQDSKQRLKNVGLASRLNHGKDCLRKESILSTYPSPEELRGVGVACPASRHGGAAWRRAARASGSQVHIKNGLMKQHTKQARNKQRTQHGQNTAKGG